MSGFVYSKNTVHNPCYDEKSGKDCERRRAGCRSSCKAWKEYEKAHAAEREERLKAAQAETVMYRYNRTKSRKLRDKK